MVPSTHMRWLTNACNSSSTGTNGHALLPFTGTCRHGEHIHVLRQTDILKKEVLRNNWFMRHLTQIQSGGYPCNIPSSATSFNTNLPLAGHFPGKSLYWLGRAMSFHECEGRARFLSHSGCSSVYNTGIIFTNLVNNKKSDLKKNLKLRQGSMYTCSQNMTDENLNLSRGLFGFLNLTTKSLLLKQQQQ